MIDPVDYETTEKEDCVRVELQTGIAFEIPHEERDKFAHFITEVYLPQLPAPLEIKQEMRELAFAIATE